MKQTIVVILSCAALLGFAGLGFANESGIVKTVRGQVLIERGSSKLEAKVGDPVQERDRLVVQSNGSVGISMSDETLLGMGPNSTMVIDRYSYDPVTREGKVETSILKGTLRYVTGLIGKANPQSIKVMTDNATIGIRGTEFIVEVPGKN
ncbi:MAG: hypothetical protein A2V78_09395 [Betaproteobacteria bacterium RBG_16_64_18]|nr:MAG: hypothetical protein A2V78_09395 [Betaproteobacteria bacterium RBG_16_64_18]OGA09479.1 MAG: hypothetical protein A3H33_08410 [Betaproteobacteria bacterium RIFCSPLOWO2_02_FULL_65_20]OGA42243.1 MAG: hypothetical protein A3G26_08375 [Betaproteobacteria bacterium RIFCSPLOWO2_12_FULL_65_110]